MEGEGEGGQGGEGQAGRGRVEDQGNTATQIPKFKNIFRTVLGGPSGPGLHFVDNELRVAL